MDETEGFPAADATEKRLPDTHFAAPSISSSLPVDTFIRGRRRDAHARTRPRPLGAGGTPSRASSSSPFPNPSPAHSFAVAVVVVVVVAATQPPPPSPTFANKPGHDPLPLAPDRDCASNDGFTLPKRGGCLGNQTRFDGCAAPGRALVELERQDAAHQC
ncbi:hypothetical protein VFPFJ_04097 [Purpureocillium lilacinum]|uniref:Uncharacterized protein n=1 Tax=Purpureocillium lilacinum TaxID=33203 RepID=A0A179HPT8_PURLI|nr:hypothetical protein VFPFJ_04097 [Purpureocillium lilacinum]OAQ92357.1 hypothetical protein VFPFJ_04097 [Purpureocillium lilacinum]